MAARLGDLPLALDQAAAYLDLTGMPLEEYLDLLDTRGRRPARLVATFLVDPATVATVWSVSIDRLRQTAARRCAAPGTVRVAWPRNRSPWTCSPPITASSRPSWPAVAADPVAMTDTIGAVTRLRPRPAHRRRTGRAPARPGRHPPHPAGRPGHGSGAAGNGPCCCCAPTLPGRRVDSTRYAGRPAAGYCCPASSSHRSRTDHGPSRRSGHHRVATHPRRHLPAGGMGRAARGAAPAPACAGASTRPPCGADDPRRGHRPQPGGLGAVRPGPGTPRRCPCCERALAHPRGRARRRPPRRGHRPQLRGLGAVGSGPARRGAAPAAACAGASTRPPSAPTTPTSPPTSTTSAGCCPPWAGTPRRRHVFSGRTQ